jgi:hypothetical protein
VPVAWRLNNRKTASEIALLTGVPSGGSRGLAGFAAVQRQTEIRQVVQQMVVPDQALEGPSQRGAAVQRVAEHVEGARPHPFGRVQAEALVP